MKNRVSIYLILFFMLALAGNTYAQHLYRGQISLPGELVREGDSLVLTMNADFRNLDLDRNQGLILTPVLVAPGYQSVYPSIMVNGKIRDRVYRRALKLDDETRMESGQYYAVIRSGETNGQTLNYRASLPYQDWMRNAQVDLVEDMEACTDRMVLIVHNIIQTAVPYEFDPVTSMIRPEAEEIKLRNDRFEAYLEFVVAKTDILPDFRNNRAELQTLENGLNAIQNDRNLTVTSLAITGYASPEGSIELNDRLSSGRAQALSEYLQKKYNFRRNLYRIDKGGEDWIKLESLVAESSDLSAKQEILDIIRNTADATQRQAKLTQLQGGTPYRQLLSEYYPKLRRVLCVVDYSVRDFTVEEGKTIIRTNPNQLSLDEMYRIAMTYPVNSEAYEEVFDIAVRTYPNDPTANLNAGVLALNKGDLSKAEMYLNKADKNSAEYYNNMGVIYMKREDYTRAEEAFRQASQKGSSVGTKNLNDILQMTGR